MQQPAAALEAARPEPGTVAICFVIAALQSVRARRLDAEDLLAQVGLSPLLLHMPQARVSAKQYGQLWRLVALTLDDEFFGQDSRRMKAGSFAMLVHAVLGCKSLEAALQRALRFFGLLLDDIAGSLVQDDGCASLVLRDRRAGNPHVFGHEVLLMLLHGLACWLVGRRIPVLRAEFAYPEPAHSAEYRLMYSVNLRFDCAATALVFAGEHLGLPVVQNERSVKEFLRTAPEGILVKYKNRTSLNSRVRRRLRQFQPHELPPFDRLARELHMTPATMRRRLHEEGASYRGIKDQLRRDLAIGYLSHTRRSVLDIASELGFSDRSSFHRAFRKWTGASPGEFRRGLLG